MSIGSSENENAVEPDDFTQQLQGSTAHDNNNFHDRALVPYVPIHFQLFRHFLSRHSSYIANLLEQTAFEEEEPYIHDDIIPSILSYCNAEALSRASCVCRRWHAIALSNELWDHLCRHEFGVSASQIKNPPNPIKRLYILSHRQLKEACRHSWRDRLTGQSFGSLRTIPVSSFRQSWS